jgi:hypothetical protein
MKTLSIVAVVALLLSLACFAQTAPPPSAFSATTISFGLTPITLPRSGQTLSGMETDAMVHFSANNIFGETSLISSSPFVGGRYDRVFPSVANWLQNHTSLTGGNFQAYATVSLGVVLADKERWGERAGLGLKYAPGATENFNIGIEAQWNNFPGIAHHIPSIAIGPNFRFGN